MRYTLMRCVELGDLSDGVGLPAACLAVREQRRVVTAEHRADEWHAHLLEELLIVLLLMHLFEDKGAVLRGNDRARLGRDGQLAALATPLAKWANAHADADVTVAGQAALRRLAPQLHAAGRSLELAESVLVDALSSKRRRWRRRLLWGSRRRRRLLVGPPSLHASCAGLQLDQRSFIRHAVASLHALFIFTEDVKYCTCTKVLHVHVENRFV